MFSSLPEMLQRLEHITHFTLTECSLQCCRFGVVWTWHISFCCSSGGMRWKCKYWRICEFCDSLSLVSPEPKTEMKTLKWAISQFASVERIVGEDKYFCENCHHYTEAERSLLFDKMPEVITIHLKCFAASGLEWVSIACPTKQGPAARENLTPRAGNALEFFQEIPR